MGSGKKYDEDSTLPPLISEEEMYEMQSSNEYYAELMSTDMLEYFLTVVNLIHT